MDIGGKQVFVAVPSEPVGKCATTRYWFRTGFASLADLQSSQYKDAFELLLPIVQRSNGELSQIVTAMEKREPGSGFHHLDELMEAQSPLTCIAHTRAYLRFQAWAGRTTSLSESKIDRLATMIGYVNHLPSP